MQILAEATPWQAIGTWALTAIGAIFVAAVPMILSWLRRIEVDQTENARLFVARKEIAAMVEKAGIYAQDKNAIAIRLDQHSRAIAELTRSNVELSTGQNHISGKIDVLLRMAEAQQPEKPRPGSG